MFRFDPLFELLYIAEGTLDSRPNLAHNLETRFGKIVGEGITDDICFVLDKAYNLIKLMLAPLEWAGYTAPERSPQVVPDLQYAV